MEFATGPGATVSFDLDIRTALLNHTYSKLRFGSNFRITDCSPAVRATLTGAGGGFDE